jgi:hypothetical protein
MLARLSLAALTAALMVTTPTVAKTKPSAQPEQVACEGVFGPDSSEALVKETFGAENVVTGTVPGPEGTEMLATTVFPDDPDRKMEFGWFDEENFTRLSYVELSPNQIAPGGVRIGQTVAEVEALNGEPFIVGGFGWDYGGYGVFQSGALANEEGACSLSVRFTIEDELPSDAAIDGIFGEVQVPSDEPLLEDVGANVQVLTLGYPWPDDLPQPEY